MSKEHSQGHAADPGRPLSHFQTDCKAHVNTGMAYARRKKLPGAPGPKKEMAANKAEYGGNAAVRVSIGHQGCWQGPGLTMKVRGTCTGILLLGTDPGKGAEELMTAAKPLFLYQK